VGNEQIDLKIVSNTIRDQNKITKIYMIIYFNIYILIKKSTKVKRNSLEYLQKKNPVYKKGRDGSPSTKKYKANKKHENTSHEVVFLGTIQKMKEKIDSL